MYLFVYGTLHNTFSPRAASAWHRFLSTAIFCGRVSVKGYLYSLGPYPALVIDEAANSLVTGELYQITEEILTALDEYEEIDPGNSESEYRRQLVELTTADGQMVQAWVYLLNQKPDENRLIASGDWCEGY